MYGRGCFQQVGGRPAPYTASLSKETTPVPICEVINTKWPPPNQKWPYTCNALAHFSACGHGRNEMAEYDVTRCFRSAFIEVRKTAGNVASDGFVCTKYNAVTKASSNFSSEEYRWRFRITRRGVLLSPTLKDFPIFVCQYQVLLYLQPDELALVQRVFDPLTLWGFGELML